MNPYSFITSIHTGSSMVIYRMKLTPDYYCSIQQLFGLVVDPEAQLIIPRYLRFKLMRLLSQLKESLPNTNTSLHRRTLAMAVNVVENGVKDVANLLKIEMLVT